MATPFASDGLDSEQLRLLGKLSQNSNLCGNSSKILQNCPQWQKLERDGTVPNGSSRVLSSLHSLPMKERSAAFAADNKVALSLLKALNAKDDKHALQYALTIIYQIVRDDTSRYDTMLKLVHTEDLCRPFLDILHRQHDQYTSDIASFLCSGLMSRAKFGLLPIAHVTEFAEKLVKRGSFAVSDAGRLQALANILKIGECRNICWALREFRELIISALTPRTVVAELYNAAFCVWLLTFSADFIPKLVDSGIIRAVCTVLKECKTEKVVRLSTRILVNSLKSEHAVEVIIEENCVQVLTLLEYEKWRDEETYNEIQEGLSTLQSKIRLHSNFDRYKRELQTGKLKWSFLHSEKFWHENVMQFEDSEFESIKMLVSLLKDPSSTPLTLAVACYDLGEFARLHPTGKRILGLLEVKALVMLLMSHVDRNVCREALLCTQKLMLDRWREAAGDHDVPTTRNH